jgi:hypothetical protein
VRREDYILRLVTQIVQALLQISGLAKTKQYQAALDAVDEACRRLLGFRLDSVDTLSEGELFARLTFGETDMVGRDKCAGLAALLTEAGRLYYAQNRPDTGYACFLHALHLMLEVAIRHPGAPLPDYAPSVETLIARLNEYSLPTGTNATLMHYYEQHGAYGKAEDSLFRLRDAEPANTSIVEVGIAFYERLMRQSDAALSAGNLPRDEVEAGLAELRAARNSL